MFYILFMSYVIVFLAEVVGDKSIYTISSLTMRFRWFTVLVGISLAFMVKMLAAVTLGEYISKLPVNLVGLISAITFFTTSIVILLKKTDPLTLERESHSDWKQSVLVPFVAIACSEWGDIGQISAAALVAQYKSPLVVWIGASLALITKGVLAIAIGHELRRRVPLDTIRKVAFSICMVLGFLSVFSLFVG